MVKVKCQNIPRNVDDHYQEGLGTGMPVTDCHLDLTLRHTLQKGCLGSGNIQRKENAIDKQRMYLVIT